MFFGPTLCMLERQGFATHVLCLSNGNYEGLGKVREKELLRSAACFSIPPSRVKIINDP